MPLTLDEGREAVRLAREVLEAHARGDPIGLSVKLLPVFSEKRGVFVTINTLVPGGKALRGCIGYSEPIKPLADAIQDVTVYASEDPRFQRKVGAEELGTLVVEVSVLTPPVDLRAQRRVALPSKVRLGVDGLIVSKGHASGLFLPQVAPEQGWDQETFIAEACAKAGLPPDAWRDGETRVQIFQAEVFGEESPRGRIVRMDPAAPI